MSESNPSQGVGLVVFDWAGTTVDHGCFAPVQPFMETLRRFDVPITAAQAREPMGLEKIDHLRALLSMPEVAARWREVHGRDWTEADVETLYREHFVPLQLDCVRDCSDVLPGVLDCVETLRSRGIRIGTTTGYFPEAASVCYAAAAEQGYRPDVNVNGGDVPAGRPRPWMMYRIMEQVDVYPPHRVIKVGDTIPDIGEGRNAGAWTVGVTVTGSEVALTAAEWQALSPDEQTARRDAAAKTLRDAGAHYILDAAAEVPRLLDEINERIAAGDRP